MAKTKNNVSYFASLSGFFFRHWRLTFVLWLAILLSGVAVYTNLIKREGFPPIQFPLTVINGTYFVDDSTTVDADITKPLSQLLTELPEVSEVQTSAGNNFFSAVIFFEDGTEPTAGTQALKDAVDQNGLIPAGAQSQFTTIDPAGYLNEFDMLLSVYSTAQVSADEIDEVANFVAMQLESDDELTNVRAQNLIEASINPLTGQTESRQTTFNKVGLLENGQLNFYQSETIGLDRAGDFDIIELSDYVRDRINEIDLSQFGDNFRIKISAEFASAIKTQINSLQNNLLTGLVAVAIVSLMLITWRASVITGLFMVTVMLTTVLILYLVGYTLNTITLFALVLALGLFVDDATIIVEAIDANRKKGRSASAVVKNAVKRVGAASFAGTMTTVLVFAPLIFVSGILGEFIRIMPVTVIIALITSLLLSLTLIPFLSRFVLLRNNLGNFKPSFNPISKLENYLALKLAGGVRLLITSPIKGRMLAFGAILLSLVLIASSTYFAGKLSFNIFPPSKDSDQISFSVEFPPNYDLAQAQNATEDVDEIVADALAGNLVKISYGTFFRAPSERGADALIELTPFTERNTKSPILIDRLQTRFDNELPTGVSARAIQIDNGPPSEEFPLTIQIYNEDETQALALAEEVRQYIDQAEISRQNNQKFKIIETVAPNRASIDRNDGRRVFEVQGAFDADDTSALLVATEDYVEARFDQDYLLANGYPADSLGFDFGQESENAESFASLGIVFPVALTMMFVLLAVQFRSLIKPLLIFLAIPFTFFGVFLGLYLTDNALSFFVQVGLVGLIGIAVNNTILLTDYANQEKRSGKGSVDAIATAAYKRFRPLVTTSLTTVVALLPLALSDPFWEPLSYTIIFGLLSSTLLVVIAFPYYYLTADWMAEKLGRKGGLILLGASVALTGLTAASGIPVILALPAYYLYRIIYRYAVK